MSFEHASPECYVTSTSGYAVINMTDQINKERRERIATAVLSGACSCYGKEDGAEAAKVAVAFADALIAELDKP